MNQGYARYGNEGHIKALAWLRTWANADRQKAWQVFCHGCLVTLMLEWKSGDIAIFVIPKQATVLSRIYCSIPHAEVANIARCSAHLCRVEVEIRNRWTRLRHTPKRKNQRTVNKKKGFRCLKLCLFSSQFFSAHLACACKAILWRVFQWVPISKWHIIQTSVDQYVTGISLVFQGTLCSLIL